MMKTKNKFFYYSALAVFIFMSLSYGCDDDDDDNVTSEQLSVAISNAEDAISEAKEGFAEGQYQRGAIAELTDYITSVNSLSLEALPKTEATTLIASVNTAVEDFKKKTVATIAQENLIGHWTMDAGGGTTAFDYSGNEFNGELKKGHANYSTSPSPDFPVLPEWSENRYGDVGKALSLDRGANVEVPYSTVLNDTSALSISVWVKVKNNADDAIYSGDRGWFSDPIVSMGGYRGYDVRLYSSNDAKMDPAYPIGLVWETSVNNENGMWSSASTDAGWGWGHTSYAVDNAQTLITKEAWHHIVVTYDKNDQGRVYIDAVAQKTWMENLQDAVATGEAVDYTDVYNANVLGGTLKSFDGSFVNNPKLIFGQDIATDDFVGLSAAGGSDAPGDDDDDSGYYTDWSGFFSGSIDEVRIYNKALSASEVSQIYELEKP